MERKPKALFLLAVPGTPVNFRIIDNSVGATYLTLTWNAAPGSLQDDFIVLYRKIGSSEVEQVMTNGSTTLQLEGLDAGGVYEVSVVAVLDDLVSQAAPISVITRESGQSHNALPRAD